MKRAPLLLLAVTTLAPCFFAGALLAQDAPRLRGPEPFTREAPAPPMQRAITNDVRVRRNYPDQPPVIPHNVRDYQITLNNNQCLTCHSRRFTEAVQAPMVSITHYVDREGQTVVQRVRVRAGVRRDAKVEIVDGLQNGDRVVIAGMRLARDGQLVRVVNSPSSDKGPPGGDKAGPASAAASSLVAK